MLQNKKEDLYKMTNLTSFRTRGRAHVQNIMVWLNIQAGYWNHRYLGRCCCSCIDYSVLMYRDTIQLRDEGMLSGIGSPLPDIQFSIVRQTCIAIGAYSLLPNPRLRVAGAPV